MTESVGISHRDVRSGQRGQRRARDERHWRLARDACVAAGAEKTPASDEQQASRVLRTPACGNRAER
jgi:hypothetical protein